ncbi:MAG: DUF4825 domain-containing protein [Oscillospiraceae bacterium]|nr:DUF4825 domain-containing protein [Oscillospiraceae bacterium]
MEHKLDCEIVRDLLPSYVDGLTSAATNRAVEDHLTDCADCSEVLRRMRDPEPSGSPPTAEVDYLKKVRRRTNYRGLMIGIGITLIGLLLLFARFFFIGSQANPSDVNYSVSVVDNTVYFTGNLSSSTSAISRIVFEESGGIVNVTVYTAPKTFFNRGEFSEQYAALGEVSGVRCEDLILWEDGTEISRTTAQLYAAKNPYVGDMSSNGRIAAILGVSAQLGPYTNELQTSQEPYGWTLLLETQIALEDESVARDIMTADSYAMLAAVGNLGDVTWQYETEAGQQEYTVSADDASAFTGQDIKQLADSPSRLQLLMQSMSIKWSGVRETLQEDGTFLLNIQNFSDAGIYGLVIDYSLNGDLIGSSTVQNADQTALTADSNLQFSFVPDDFPENTSAIRLSGFSFDLAVIGNDGSETTVCEDVPVSAKYAWTFYYSLTGDFETGFVLNEG